MDPRQTVREGYDKIALHYTSLRGSNSADVKLLNLFVERLDHGFQVLDAGRGSGIPVSRSLLKSFQVTGLDFSNVQLRFAKRNTLHSSLVCADMVSLPFRDATFDAVASYYAIIHIPRTAHRSVLSEFHRVLKAGGLCPPVPWCGRPTGRDQRLARRPNVLESL